MKEQARQEMAEEDLGGGMFDQDVKGMRDFAAKVSLPQIYDPDERKVLDEQLALHEMPGKGLRKYKTGTKLYTCQVADTGSGVDVRAEMEIRAPVEQVRVHREGRQCARRLTSSISLASTGPRVLHGSRAPIQQAQHQRKKRRRPQDRLG
jgi:hypothetical protein